MMVSAKAAQSRSRAEDVDDLRPAERPFDLVWVLLLLQAGALVIQVLAMCMARQDADEAAVVSCCGFGLTFASALWFLTRPRLTRAVRNTAVVCLGVTTAVQWRLIDPLIFTGFDEQLHMRTLRDIESSHGLFQANPLLGVSSRYPGLEAVTALFHQLGLPLMAAAVAVVLVARLVLVLVLCDAVEQLTGSARAGGLAVAVYAVSPQFVFFNSQFAYQSLALPLALAAVAFIARARWVADPRLLLSGATVCLLAVAVTHHVTACLTAGFLAVWTIAQRGGQAKRRVFYGAAIAAVATTTWATIQWSLLRDYFGPVIDDWGTQLAGGFRRAPFSDSTGYTLPLWQRVFLVYYAAVVSLVVLGLVLMSARSMLRRVWPGTRRCKGQPWEPRILLILMAAMIPLLLAARVIPKGGEFFDRSSSFLFLPLSLLVADGIIRWRRSRPRHRGGTAKWVVLTRPVALALATGVFVGGYLLGSGPDWARLPGGYLASADGRSMDAETLAAVRWARDNIPAGSRIGADRVSSVLLASQARMWPVLHQGRLDVPSLYLADDWGPPQSEMVRSLHLRYLYVDRRLADELPHVGSYFYRGETSAPQQLTGSELAKFDNVEGIQTVYRHGPISIYELSGLGVPQLRSGWLGTTRPMGVPAQLVIGLLVGLVVTLIGRSGAGPTVIEKIKTFQTAAGPSLTFAAGVGALCIVSATMLLAHVWLGPTVFLPIGLVVLLANRHRATHALRNSGMRPNWRWIAASGIVAIPVATAISLAILDAYFGERFG